MKRFPRLLTLLFFFCGLSITSNAQVAIGTSAPNPSAQLHVYADDKGLLIPEVSLTSNTDATTITNGNVVGLMVYNTNNTATLNAGFCYWDGTEWVNLENDGFVTSLAFDSATGDLTYIDELNNPKLINLVPFVANSFSEAPVINALDNLIDNDPIILHSIDSLVAVYERVTILSLDTATGVLTYLDDDSVTHTYGLFPVVANSFSETTVIDALDDLIDNNAKIIHSIDSISGTYNNPNYSTDEYLVGNKWIDGSDIYAVVYNHTVSTTPSALIDLSTTDVASATKILNVKILSTTGRIYGVYAYDLATDELTVGSGAFSTVLPVGSYEVIVEYLK